MHRTISSPELLLHPELIDQIPFTGPHIVDVLRRYCGHVAEPYPYELGPTDREQEITIASPSDIMDFPRNLPPFIVAISAKGNAGNIEALLRDVKDQLYPPEKVFPIVFDNDSLDSTGYLAQHSGAKFIRLSNPNPRLGKSLNMIFDHLVQMPIDITPARCLPADQDPNKIWVLHISGNGQLSNRCTLLAAAKTAMENKDENAGMIVARALPRPGAGFLDRLLCVPYGAHMKPRKITKAALAGGLTSKCCFISLRAWAYVEGFSETLHDTVMTDFAQRLLSEGIGIYAEPAVAAHVR